MNGNRDLSLLEQMAAAQQQEQLAGANCE